MCALCEIDVDYFFFDDTPPDKHPDSHSPTLRRYHQLLWSKPLPDGRPFELHAGRARSPYLVYEADGTRIVLGSDTIATRHRRKLFRLYEQLPDEVNDAFLHRSYTLCGFMVFPVSRGSLNQNRGTHPRIQNWWDLTLEAIRRFYDGGPSPLAATMDRHAGFFELFGSFAGTSITSSSATSSTSAVQCASCFPSRTSKAPRCPPTCRPTSATGRTALRCSRHVA